MAVINWKQQEVVAILNEDKKHRVYPAAAGISNLAVQNNKQGNGRPLITE